MTVLAVDFTGQVLRELVAALGGALFVGNLVALVRRRESPGDLTRAPVVRTVVYLVLGFVVMLWGIASLAVS